MLKSLASGNRQNEEAFITLNNAADIFKYNDWALRQILNSDSRKKSQPSQRDYGKAKDNIFIEEFTDIESAI